jgi:tetratricopeptide (TPR) repeat protein
MRQKQRNALAIAAMLALATTAAAAPAARHHHHKGGRAVGASQEANAAAAEGYKAYAKRDYAAAVQEAQRAVELAPKRRDYWLLLANALAADGQHARAEQALDRAAQLPGDAAQLARTRADLARMRAQAEGDAMYKALGAGDIKGAIAHGTEAVRYAPENAGFRLVLVHALLRDGRYADAERVANETIALLPESAAPLAMRAYARQGLGRPAEARADLERALQQKGLSAQAQRQLRLMAADLALAQDDGTRALQLLQPLPADDADAAARREFARQRIASPGAATAYALRAPGIDCSNVAAQQTCTVTAAAVPPLPGFANATAAYRALEEKDTQRALEQARLATQASPTRRDWQLMHMNAALAAGQYGEAERAASAALALGPDPMVLAQRSSIRRHLGDVAGANADAEAALQSGQLPPTTQASLLADLGRKREARAVLASAAPQATPQNALDRAYLSTRIGDSEAAREAFAQADGAGGLPATSLLDAGYAAMHSKHDAEAVNYFKRAIDAADGLQLKLDPQMLYDTRRTVADLTRKWGVLASVTMRNGSGVVPGFGLTGGSPGVRTTQAGVEGYYRPWGYRNGEFVELFARGFWTLDSQMGGLTGGDSFTGGVGIRWKPISAQNLVLSFSRVFGPNVTGDWLAQIAYSYDVGTDLRVDRDSWWTVQGYAEAGRYLEQGINYGLASLLVGRSFIVSADRRTVLFPHGFVGVEYTSNDPVAKTAAGIGPGISLRRWFREDKYDAPRSYWDVTLQYRARITGDDRMKGPYVNALLNY